MVEKIHFWFPVYPDLTQPIGGVKQIHRVAEQLILLGHLGAGLDELTLTTNGSQLERFADDLYAAGKLGSKHELHE